MVETMETMRGQILRSYHVTDHLSYHMTNRIIIYSPLVNQINQIKNRENRHEDPLEKQDQILLSLFDFLS
tara:strand:+ start:679 stop:888 length:210 start_codon:yes stop_codon:yes gene_type:complete